MALLIVEDLKFFEHSSDGAPAAISSFGAEVFRIRFLAAESSLSKPFFFEFSFWKELDIISGKRLREDSSALEIDVEF